MKIGKGTGLTLFLFFARKAYSTKNNARDSKIKFQLYGNRLFGDILFVFARI